MPRQISRSPKSLEPATALPAAKPEDQQNSPSLLRQLAAVLYDSILVCSLLFVATLIGVAFRGGTAFPAGDLIYTVYLGIVGLGFYAWFWIHGGQTLGMKAWKIRLISDNGRKVSLNQALIRGLTAILSTLCFGLGYLWVFISEDKLTWQDLASGTRLIYPAAD